MNPSVFQKCSRIKHFSIVGVSRFCRSFLSHSTKKFVYNPPMIQKKLGHPKFLCTKEEANDFPWIYFGLSVPKNFMGERFCVSENFQYGNNLWRRRGVTFFCRELFVQNRRRKSWAKPFVFQNCFGIKNFLDNRDIRIFSNFFVPHRQKSSWPNPFVFQNYSGIKMFWIIGLSRFC